MTTLSLKDDTRAEKERLLAATRTTATAIARLMEDRVRHMTALRQIAQMTETGIITKGGHDVYRIAREARSRSRDSGWSAAAP